MPCTVWRVCRCQCFRLVERRITGSPPLSPAPAPAPLPLATPPLQSLACLLSMRTVRAYMSTMMVSGMKKAKMDP